MQHYIGKTQIKKWLVSELKPFLQQYGFKIKSSVNVDIWKNSNLLRFGTFCSVDYNDIVTFTTAGLRIHKVEEVIHEITGILVYKEVKDTIHIVADNLGSLRKIITCQQDVVELAGTFRQVFEEVYLPGFERFSQPERILEFWDSFEEVAERTRYFQDGYAFLKILIISKMIREDKYMERVQNAIKLATELVNTEKPYHAQKLEICNKLVAYLEAHELSW